MAGFPYPLRNISSAISEVRSNSRQGSNVQFAGTIQRIGETYGTAIGSMRNGLFALLWLNLRIRWREWQGGEADGAFLQQMRALRAAEVIRPRSSRDLRLVRSNPQRTGRTLRRLA